MSTGSAAPTQRLRPAAPFSSSRAENERAGDWRRLSLCRTRVVSDHAHVLGARALGALPDRERNPLPLLQLVVIDTFERRHVEEHVVTAAGADETKTLVRETLDRTFSHVHNS